MAKLTEAATYTVAVKSTALGKSKQKGSPQIVIAFEDVVNGDTITAYLSCVGGAWQYTEEALRTLGWDAAIAGYQFEELNLDPSPIAGNQADIVCDFESWDGKRELRVKFINPVGGGFKRMDDGEAASFAEQLRAQIGVTRSGGASSRRAGPPSQQPNGRTPAGNDDIPF